MEIVDVRPARWTCAVCWLVVLGLALMAFFVEPGFAMIAFFGALVLMAVTVWAARVTREEVCTMPFAYRGVMATLFAVALGGVIIGVLPDTRDTSQLLAILFGVVALLAYRGLVSRGPRAAIVAVAIILVLWLPFGFLALFGSHHPHKVPPWTTVASLRCLAMILVLLPATAAVTLFSFRPRSDVLPAARLLG